LLKQNLRRNFFIDQIVLRPNVFSNKSFFDQKAFYPFAAELVDTMLFSLELKSKDFNNDCSKKLACFKIFVFSHKFKPKIAVLVFADPNF